jgi:hypothetical protein
MVAAFFLANDFAGFINTSVAMSFA